MRARRALLSVLCRAGPRTPVHTALSELWGAHLAHDGTDHKWLLRAPSGRGMPALRGGVLAQPGGNDTRLLHTVYGRGRDAASHWPSMGAEVSALWVPRCPAHRPRTSHPGTAGKCSCGRGGARRLRGHGVRSRMALRRVRRGVLDGLKRSADSVSRVGSAPPVAHDEPTHSSGCSPSSAAGLRPWRRMVRRQLFQRRMASSLPAGRSFSAFSYHSIAWWKGS